MLACHPRGPAVAVASLLLLCCVWPAVPARAIEADSEDEPGLTTKSAPTALMLRTRRAVPRLDELPESDADAAVALHDLTAWNKAGGRPTRAGFTRRLRRDHTIRLRGRALRDLVTEEEQNLGVVDGTDATRIVWTSSVRVRNAHGLKIAVRGTLPSGSTLWAYGKDLVPQGPVALGDGSEVTWSPIVLGDTAWLEVHMPRDTVDPAGAYAFTVDEIMQVVPLADDGTPLPPGLGSEALSTSCLLDAACASIPSFLGSAGRGVGRMFFVSGGSGYVCTGGLLNDKDPNGFKMYFLTAHHCISTASEASSLEVWWDYRRASCGGPTPSASTLPKSFGADILATRSSSDATFLQLRSSPGGRTFLGWTTSTPGTAALYRLHHPAGNPLHYSRHSGCPSCGTCSALSSTEFIYSTDEIGGQTGGSSGSVVLIEGDTSARVVGQLYGACGPNVDDDCDRRNRAVDGRFSRTFPSIDDWINVEVPLVPTTTTTTTSTTTSSTVPATTTTTLSPQLPPVCADAIPIPPNGGEFDGATSGISTLSALCTTGTETAPEAIFAWTPSESGTAFISTTFPTSFDTVLSLRTDDCASGPELACNDDLTGDGLSFFSVTVEAGRRYYIVVDGFGGASGAFRLRVTAPLPRSQCSVTCDSFCRTVQCPRRKKKRKKCIKRCLRSASVTCSVEGQCF